MRLILAVFIAAALSSTALSATLQTVVLVVQNMTCNLCQITVRKSLEKVEGVSSVSVDFASRTATVRFDADKVSAEELAKATASAGYPSTIRK